ncbi:Uncharacterised protein [BD1-7 clade bacterium]|uniref:Chromosome partition protein Smc n=1 Tax=BD1-7 clade bacterium TaxID=2029982 RepID=A0A5S9P7D8_9GAMM|nr:Uncharacterised protein [BD1-7 clade bacterium]
MDQAQLEIELGAWKNIAIDKQVLVSDVVAVLGLEDDCTNEQLKSALKAVISQASEAESKVQAAKQDVDSLKKKLVENEKTIAGVRELEKEAGSAKQIAEDATAAAKDAEEKAEHRIQTARAANADELKKATLQVKEKQKELQAVNKVLADTPENVVKKLKTLKKEKFDESTARKSAEADARTLRKQVKELEQEVDRNKETLEKSAELVEPVRDLKKLCNAQKDQLGELVEDASTLDEIPDVDDTLLEALEQFAATEEA